MYCEECAAKRTAYQADKRKGVSQSKCPNCRRRWLKPGEGKCSVCRRRNRESMRRKRDQWREQALCSNCGAEMTWSRNGRKTCGNC